MSIEIERSDFMRQKGRLAVLSVGPFRFYANTADEGMIAFEIIIGTWSWGWTLQGDNP